MQTQLPDPLPAKPTHSVAMEPAEFRRTWLVVEWMEPTVAEAERLRRLLIVDYLATPWGRYVQALSLHPEAGGTY